MYPGLILSASVESGLCMLRNVAGESVEHVLARAACASSLDDGSTLAFGSA